MGIAYFRLQQPFRQMIKNDGLTKVMDNIAESPTKFTNSLIDAKNDVDRKNNQQVGKAANEMDANEKKAALQQNLPF